MRILRVRESTERTPNYLLLRADSLQFRLWNIHCLMPRMGRAQASLDAMFVAMENESTYSFQLELEPVLDSDIVIMVVQRPDESATEFSSRAVQRLAEVVRKGFRIRKGGLLLAETTDPERASARAILSRELLDAIGRNEGSDLLISSTETRSTEERSSVLALAEQLATASASLIDVRLRVGKGQTALRSQFAEYVNLAGSAANS